MAIPEERKKSLLQKAWTLGKALLTGRNVSADRMRERIEICSNCELVEVQGEKLQCGVCGCGLSNSPALINLARFEETEDYGCQHPLGSRWKEKGV